MCLDTLRCQLLMQEKRKGDCLCSEEVDRSGLIVSNASLLNQSYGLRTCFRYQKCLATERTILSQRENQFIRLGSRGQLYKFDLPYLHYRFPDA